jgi:hypothetical protein
MAERVAARTYYTEVIIDTNSDGLSNVVDGKGYRLIKIFMPDEWTPADLTFQEGAYPEGPFYDLYDDTSITTGAVIPIYATPSIEVSIPISPSVPNTPMEITVSDVVIPPKEVKVQVAAGKNTVISYANNNFIGMAYFKIRSGTSDNPVQQAAKRKIGLLFSGV